jgi:imidazolonepropionase-like amidohydrolase
MKKRAALITTLLVSFACLIQGQSKLKAIKAGKFIDTERGTVLENQVILIDSNKITAVGANLNIPAEAEVIDLSGSTVLPGLIDCHVHITNDPGKNYYEDIFRRTDIDEAIKAHIYAKRTLEAGFTLCRNAGAQNLIDVSLRNAINEGSVVGPRLLVSTFPLGATGGHADLTGFNPNIDWKYNPEYTGVANGVDEIRKRVRNNIKWGADWIKFMATAGVLSEEESVGAPQYSFEEMKALCDEAHLWGKKVCAHAHGAEGIKMAIKAGVSSVEHCSLVDDEGIKLMKQKGVYMVPTIYAVDYIIESFSSKGYPAKIIEKAKKLRTQKNECFKKAVKAGVKIAYGTDASVMPNGWNARDFRFMVNFGMTPMQAIQSATINAADLLDWKTKVGSITAGKLADIIAIDGNPIQDISILEHVKFVMKDGVVYKNELEKN